MERVEIDMGKSLRFVIEIDRLQDDLGEGREVHKWEKEEMIDTRCEIDDAIKSSKLDRWFHCCHCLDYTMSNIRTSISNTPSTIMT